ncbi:unnamed protein product [Coffea canephora]|uniref:Uncharacterized protein n=1 Tax=Coffea canephora TaxID=49390 RepID=A0A068UHB4_COFCA|nr:unnamed protein product [Coffea canephora]
MGHAPPASTGKRLLIGLTSACLELAVLQSKKERTKANTSSPTAAALGYKRSNSIAKFWVETWWYAYATLILLLSLPCI